MRGLKSNPPKMMTSFMNSPCLSLLPGDMNQSIVALDEFLRFQEGRITFILSPDNKLNG